MNNTKQEQHWKVRISLRNCGMLHIACSKEPVVTVIDGQITSVQLATLDDPTITDRIGFIQWQDVCAISWRQEEADETPKWEPKHHVKRLRV